MPFVSQAFLELDEAKRAEIYHEMGVLMRDDGGTVLPYFPNFVFGRRNWVGSSGSGLLHHPRIC